jgi:hypothetical protein
MTPRLKPRVDKTPTSGLTLSHVARPTAAPQDSQMRLKPLVRAFCAIFRNEEVAGSNPASSTNALVRALSARSSARRIHDPVV